MRYTSSQCFEIYSKHLMFSACPASLTFKAAHLHTREFSGYRIPSLHLYFVSSSLPSSSSSQACLLLQCFLPCGEAAPWLTGSVTDSSHSTLFSCSVFFFMLSPSFYTQRQKHTHTYATTISISYPYNILEE